MSILTLKNINLNQLINENNSILTIKELLTKINYNLDNLYIDRFWNSIQDDKWIYLDNWLINDWLGYKDIKHGKEQIIKLLKKYNKENDEYKILNNTEFDINEFCAGQSMLQNINEEKRGAHNKQYIILSPDCFKELCIHVGTKKSAEIKKYYIELEKIFKFYLEYQNKFRELELLEKDNIINDNIINAKLDKHKYLIDKFSYKQCIYIIELNIIVHDNQISLIKIGSTKNIHKRIVAMDSAYSCKCILLDIYECENNYQSIEQYILTNKEIKAYLYKEKINNTMPKDIIQLSDKFNYDQLLSIVNESIKKNVYLNPCQLLEKQKMDLLNRLLDKGYNPNLFENFTITIITKNENNSICIECQKKNNTTSNESTELTELNNSTDNIIKDFYINKESDSVADSITDSTNNSIEEINIIPFKIKHSRGRKIQKINPNNLDVVVKVYDSMIYLLRSNEGVKYLKSGIQDAIRRNAIYKGYRWCFVEKDEDPMISKVKPTDTNISSRITEPIVKINMTKDKIIDIYKNQEECFLNNGLTKSKLKELIKYQKVYHNFYFMKISDCNQTLLNKYNLSNELFKKNTNSKSIIAINPLSKEEIIFNTITEIPIKLGGTESSINSAIKYKTIYNGYYWKLKD
jgi:hypothetical protein